MRTIPMLIALLALAPLASAKYVNAWDAFEDASGWQCPGPSTVEKSYCLWRESVPAMAGHALTLVDRADETLLFWVDDEAVAAGVFSSGAQRRAPTGDAAGLASDATAYSLGACTRWVGGLCPAPAPLLA